MRFCFFCGGGGRVGEAGCGLMWCGVVWCDVFRPDGWRGWNGRDRSERGFGRPAKESMSAKRGRGVCS